MLRPSLRDLEAFAAVAAQRHFGRAAASLGVSRSSLSHTMAGLERALGVRLLHRTTRSVAPTDAGARLLERLGPVLREFALVFDGVGAPAGRLRINASARAARVLLDRVVPRFLQLHPAVELDLVTEGRLIDIVDAGFDAGVRLLDQVPQDMIAVPFGGPVRFVAVAAPDYLGRRGAPAVPDDLRDHSCIRQRLPSGARYRWEFSRRGEAAAAVDVPGALTLDDNELMVEAAVRGVGIAFVPEAFAAAALRSGALVRVLEDWCPPGPGLALYYPGARLVPSALRAFVGVLREGGA